jgi:hypothetical protein
MHMLLYKRRLHGQRNVREGERNKKRLVLKVDGTSKA